MRVSLDKSQFSIFNFIHPLAGIKNQLTTLKKGDDAVTKNEKVITVTYTEASLLARRERVKSGGAS